MGRPPIARRAEQVELYTALPEDIPQSVWSKWPTKSEAHVVYGVRKRIVSSRILKGVLKPYACPDDSVRIPTEQLDRELGAEAPPVAKSDRARRAAVEEDLELDDPLVGMFRECRLMLREERDHSRAQIEQRDQTNAEQLKLLTGPVQTAARLLEELAQRLSARVQFLEERQDAVIAERELMADFRQERDVQIESLRAREKRRDGVLALLKRELGPVLISKLGGGDSLATFVAGVRPELIELLINSGELTPEQTARLKRIAEQLRTTAAERAADQTQAAPAAAAEPAAAQSNGAAPAH